MKKEGDVPLFPLSTKQPKADGLRYAFLVYGNLHRGSNWDVAKWIAKSETSKRGAGLTDKTFYYALEDGSDGQDTKLVIQSRVGRYKSSEKTFGKCLLGSVPMKISVTSWTSTPTQGFLHF